MEQQKNDLTELIVQLVEQQSELVRRLAGVEESLKALHLPHPEYLSIRRAAEMAELSYQPVEQYLIFGVGGQTIAEEQSNVPRR